MKNIKKFYKEHRVFTILMAIVIVCAILIATVLIQCFYVGNGSDKYGHRLDGIENHPVSESLQSDYKNNLTNNEKVKSVDLIVTGKIIYITVQFQESVDLEEAKNIAAKSLEDFSEDIQGFYDFNITLKKNTSNNVPGFLISGAKNVNGSGLTWNNNREVTEQEADEKSTEKENS